MKLRTVSICLMAISSLMTGCHSSIDYPEKVIHSREGPKMAAHLAVPETMEQFEHDFKAHGIKVTRQGEQFRLILPSDMFFENNVREQDYLETATLYNVMQFYKQYGTAPIEVLAFTDSVGDHDQLQSKSQLQANSIAAFFWANGIADNNIIIKALGPNQKLDTRKTPPSRASNRRIEIRFNQSAETAPI